MIKDGGILTTLNPATGEPLKQARLRLGLRQQLLQHRGEVIEREELFKQVWDTNYTGDTRTLDVHISWLRRAIEMDPNHPRFLHTVRGVGYRLDV